MIRNTADPVFAKLSQQALRYLHLYAGEVDGFWGPVSDNAYERYAANMRYVDAASIAIKLTADQQADLAHFLKQWKTPAPHSLYVSVAHSTDVPPELVAALHWRESGGDFKTYLQNGDPLGAPTVHEPHGLLFNSWTTAAIDAINREKCAMEMSCMSPDGDLISMCVFAEYYNGEGYAVRGLPDAYVLSGTAAYSSGKFKADGVFDPAVVDPQIGVLPLLRAIL